MRDCADPQAHDTSGAMLCMSTQVSHSDHTTKKMLQLELGTFNSAAQALVSKEDKYSFCFTAGAPPRGVMASH